MADQFAQYRHDPDVVYHWTDHDSAEQIVGMGFDDDLIGTKNGQSSGPGHYFAPYPEQARKYGSSVVAARLGNIDVHPNPWMDSDVQHEVDSLHKRNPTPRGLTDGDWRQNLIVPALQERRYYGHQDPDDGAIIVHEARHVTPLGVQHDD